MNIPARVELMEVLTEIGQLVPYYRLGQLICIIAERAEVEYVDLVANIEDEELLPAAKEFLESMRRRPPEHIAEQIRLHQEGDAIAAAADRATAPSGTR